MTLPSASLPLWPIAASQRADDQWGPFDWDGADLFESLPALSAGVRALVPGCVGISLSLREEGITITLVAAVEDVALLDEAQGAERPATGSDADVDPGPADEHGGLEQGWRLDAAATGHAGISSTLSLPVVRGADTVAEFTLYAPAGDAFDGQHEQLASHLGAWSGGVVTDADLTFSSRELAERAPEILRDAADLAVAASLLARTRELSYDDAADRLNSAALRANVPLTKLVSTVLDLLDDR